ncbi:MAG: hypothetical protein ACREHC_07935 [Candidatus Levyibacteriota bacterium]
MPDSYSAAQSSLSFAKLVATPTDTTWSQAYNAGNLFVCISLSTQNAPEELSLQSVGKDLFDVLQSEFFTLEQKDTEHINKAMQLSLEKVPQDIEASITLTFFKESMLSIVIASSGKVVMKRKEKVGVLLQKPKTSPHMITAATGFLQNGDTIVIETGPFAQEIPHETVRHALDLEHPNDIVEALSPQMHAQDNGALAAIVITYRGASHAEKMVTEEVPPEDLAEPEEQTVGGLYESDNLRVPEQELPEELPPEKEQSAKKAFSMKLPSLPHTNFHLSHRRKLFLNIALILLLLLGASIFLTLKKQTDKKQQAIFQSIYPQAQQDYQTGQGLETLNPQLSQENYKKAESLLKDGETKIKKGSDYYNQMDALLTKVESSLNTSTTGQTTAIKEVTPDKNSLLQIEEANKDGIAFGEDANDVYMITTAAISTISKTSGDKKDIIKNTNYWSAPQAIVPYQGNIYVLDQKGGVLKFVAGAGGFGKSSYFTSNAPDLSQATGMAIDGSVWLVLKNGSLLDYTKGKSNGIQITGLQKPLNNPTKLVTDISMEHVYILDQGNSRIVQFDKHGAYQNAYMNPLLGKATDFTVSEKNKEILVLSGGKVWQINL